VDIASVSVRFRSRLQDKQRGGLMLPHEGIMKKYLPALEAAVKNVAGTPKKFTLGIV